MGRGAVTKGSQAAPRPHQLRRDKVSKRFFKDQGFDDVSATRWANRCRNFNVKPEAVMRRLLAQVRADRELGSEYPLSISYREWGEGPC